MKLKSIVIKNFRRLENIKIDFEVEETIFVGPNNSGKTSATAIFRCFLDGRGFKAYDFSVARIPDFDIFVEKGDVAALPEISLDLWFEIDPNSIGFGRVFTLLPNFSDFSCIGLRLSYGIADARKLREAYVSACPLDDSGKRSMTLFQYLAVDTNLSRHSTVRYASLENSASEARGSEVKSTLIEPEEGRRLVKNLIRVDFVDAQRNINDDDGSRSNKLSSAFASYYRKNLDQKEFSESAYGVIKENNASLTDHYEKQFTPLFNMIKGLGVPAVNDRDLRIVSSLSPEAALRGSTELLYVDSNRKHELPEQYNGLGFKNLIYMAIQARHFHSQWLETAENRPLCQLVFIEEPEVHLHAQVQKTFIANICKVIKESAQFAGQPGLTPQLVVTTHSSHILDTVDFERVRYFKRRHLDGEEQHYGILNASDVLSLREFRPTIDVVGGKDMKQDDALAFLKKYLRLTHCDLFFADAAILVEGAAEKLLMPSMIEASANQLSSRYFTVLEVGGAYAHRFDELLKFLGIPYLVITDLDSVESTGREKSCRADFEGAITSNSSLKKYFNKKLIADLVAIQSEDKIDIEYNRCIAFQCDVEVADAQNHMVMRPRTFEEAIAYENFKMLRDGALSIGVNIPSALDSAYGVIYKRINSNKFKKTDFAMSLLEVESAWIVPAYIAEGLRWLERRLSGAPLMDEPEKTPEAPDAVAPIMPITPEAPDTADMPPSESFA